jgi:hypothetical protein
MVSRCGGLLQADGLRGAVLFVALSTASCARSVHHVGRGPEPAGDAGAPGDSGGATGESGGATGDSAMAGAQGMASAGGASGAGGGSGGSNSGFGGSAGKASGGAPSAAGGLNAPGGAGMSSQNAGTSSADAGNAQGGSSSPITGPGHPTCADGLRVKATPGATADTGAVLPGTNCLGIQGKIVLAADSYGSEIAFTSLDDHICVSGHTGAVSDGDYEHRWGVSVGIELRDSLSYDAVSYGIKGFSFDLTGSVLPPAVEPMLFTSNNVPYCALVCAGGTESITFDQISSYCWLRPTGGELGFGSDVSMLGFGIGGLPEEVPFDFCIDDLGGFTGIGPGNSTICTTDCKGRCGERSDWCSCDADCTTRADCCVNYTEQCQ